MNFSDEQISAISQCTRDGLRIVTGGAGTGKTYVIRGIVEELGGGCIELCAPTGKAAARIREVTGQEAATIHRMLGWRGEFFTRKPFGNKTVIMDEASMCDATLMAEIVKRKPWRLILVGDAAQLRPVGKGAPFHDLIEYCPDRVSQLTHCFRSTAAIANAALAVRDGKHVPGNSESGGEKWNLINTGTAAQTHSAIVKWVDSDRWDWKTDIVICPRNGDKEEPDALTVAGLNESLVRIANPRDDYSTYAPGDRVINLKNHAAIDVWNGDTGTVQAVDISGNVWVQMDRGGDQVLWPKSIIHDTQLAYALTVHKSQGSEFRNVIFGCVKRDSRLLTKSLVYTAITRARKACAVAGEYAAFFQGITNNPKKTTVLQALLKG